MASYVITQILKNRTITDYLESRGFYPVGSQQHGKLKYLCPLHKEKAPSFNVYLNAEFQNFFCYGCKASSNIIHLYRDLEGITLGGAIKALANGLDLNVDAEIRHAIAEVENDTSIFSTHNSVELSLQINRMLYEFLQAVERNPKYLPAVEKIYALVDAAADANKLDELNFIQNSLDTVLVSKILEYREEKEKVLMKETEIDML